VTTQDLGTIIEIPHWVLSGIELLCEKLKGYMNIKGPDYLGFKKQVIK